MSGARGGDTLTITYWIFPKIGKVKLSDRQSQPGIRLVVMAIKLAVSHYLLASMHMADTLTDSLQNIYVCTCFTKVQPARTWVPSHAVYRTRSPRDTTHN